MRKVYLALTGVIVVIVLSIIAFPIISDRNNEEYVPNIKVATSIFPIYDITQNIAGDMIELVKILPAGASPHTYSSTVQDQLKLEGVDISLKIGYELDDWTDDIVIASSPEVKIYTVDNNISFLLTDDHDHSHDEDSDHSHEEDEHEEEVHSNEEELVNDPHYWLSIDNSIIIAENIKDILVENDPENAEYYENNFSKYQSELISLKEAYQERYDSTNNNGIVTFHNAFNYLADEFGFEILATVEEFPGNEPTPAYLASVGKVIEETNINYIFKEPQLSDSIVEPISRDYDVDILTLDSLGGLDDRDSLIKMLSYNLDTILIALEDAR